MCSSFISNNFYKGEEISHFLCNKDFYNSGGFIVDSELSHKIRLIMTDPDYMHTFWDNINLFFENCDLLLSDEGILVLIVDVRDRSTGFVDRNKLGLIMKCSCMFNFVDIGHVIEINEHRYIFIFSREKSKFLRNLKILYDNEQAMGEAKDKLGDREPFHDNLLSGIILALTNEYDWVCDPFCGTNSVGKFCKQYGRNYVGFEIDHEQYLTIIKGD